MRKLLICIILFIGLKGVAQTTKPEVYIPLAGNAYIISAEKGARITNRGLEGWSGERTVISVYFAIPAEGEYDLALNAKGNAEIRVVCGKKDFVVKIHTDDFQVLPVGKIKMKQPGYVWIDLIGIHKTGESYGEIEGIYMQGGKGNWTYVKDFSTYWGRRGPSVHLNYTMPEGKTEWFYNEVMVPKDGEVEGSYYMVNGFGEGYFGMQYNSKTERRVLFSVWSPFDTQDPQKIPEDERVVLLRKGEGVHIGEFGNEGSGGQSYLKYNWKAGIKYPFLMRVHPDGNGNTIYTAYFYATDEGRWRLIASFQRPKTDTWYRNAHSFLENFNPEQGYLRRRVIFSNQWVCDKEGVWEEINRAKFTYDATAGAGVRKDYQGGLIGDQSFYLQNGGFFNGSTDYGTAFTRKLNRKHPEIDFRNLEKL